MRKFWQRKKPRVNSPRGKETSEMPIQKQKAGAVALSMMIVVGDKDQSKKMLKIMECHKAYFSLATHAKGTANSKILNYLGLGESDKMMYMSIRPTEEARLLIDELDEKIKLYKHGHGVAFKSNLEKGCYHRPVKLKQDETGGSDMAGETAHEMVVVIVNQGYTDDVMEAARAAGAGGGTALHARGCGLVGAEKFFGITVQPEKEIIIIVTQTEKTEAIMQAIGQTNGPETDAGAVSFSLPVNHVRGLSGDEVDI